MFLPKPVSSQLTGFFGFRGHKIAFSMTLIENYIQ